MRLALSLPLASCLAMVAALPVAAQDRSFNFALRGGVGACQSGGLDDSVVNFHGRRR